jgi:hypothetical protein
MAQQFITPVRTELTVPLQTQRTGATFFSRDNLANRIVVEVCKNHTLQNLEGEVTGYVMRDNGSLVIIPGGIDEGKAYIDLPEAAYAIVGKDTIAVQVKNGETKTTIALLEAYVKNYIPEETVALETNVQIINAPNIYVEGDTLFVMSQVH